MINEILLRRKNKVLIRATPFYETPSDNNFRHIASMARNISSLGFTFSKKLVDTLGCLTISQLVSFYNQLVPLLQNLVGADKEYRPMYTDFPDTLMDFGDCVLYLNAVKHYSSNGAWVPDSRETVREYFNEFRGSKIIDIADDSDVVELARNLMESKTSLSEQDKEDLKELIEFKSETISTILPESFPFKENMIFVVNTLINLGIDANCLSKYFKTATDVLRLITAFSDGDISLATNTRYKKFSRPERRLFMDLLANCYNPIDDMCKHKGKWLCVGEILHPMEFKGSKYANVRLAFDTIRNHFCHTMIGYAETKIRQEDYLGAATILQDNPGEFARRLDKLLRESTQDNCLAILRLFNSVAHKVSVPVLLNLRQHFKDRNKMSDTRTFFIKGNAAKYYTIDNNLDNIPENICHLVVVICNTAIKMQLGEKEPLGKVYVNSSLKNYIVPFSQRSANSSSKILTRGSRFAITEDVKVLRPFIWWTNDEHNSRVDLDLTAAIYDENFEYKQHVSYTNLYIRDEEDLNIAAIHSGDLVNGGSVDGSGVAEFIDLDIKRLSKIGRYIVFCVFSYTNSMFSELPNCNFGWMKRENPKSGEIFEPTTVEDIIKLNNSSRNGCIPMIFDLQTRKIIWCDMELKYCGRFAASNIESNSFIISNLCRAMVTLDKPDLYSLAMLNAFARGKLTNSMEEADTIFSDNCTASDFKDKTVITPYDIDYIISQLM